MRVKRFFVVAAVGTLALPAYWHPATATVTQCSDKIDNDGDGGIDNDGGDVPGTPKDLDCDSFLDDSEAGPRGAGPSGTTNNSSSSSSTATNTNNNTSTNNNTNTSSSNSSSTSNSTSSSSSSACLLLCNADLLSNVLSGLPVLGG